MQVKNRNAVAAGARRLLLAWLIAVTVGFLLLPEGSRNLAGLDALTGLSMGLVCAVTAGMFVSFTVCGRFFPTRRTERWAMVGAFTLLAASALLASFSWSFLGFCVLLEAIFLVYAGKGWDGRSEVTAYPKPENRWCLPVVLGLTGLFFLFVSVWTVCRVWSFSTPTYDFGIFSQMFYSMKTTGLPMTTVERDGSLSHFAVHVSPIYYLLLPFYCLFPSPAILQMLQAAVLASAVIPLWKLGKLHGLSPIPRTLLCALLLVYPAFSGGASYDIHENCFLTPLLLWLFYALDRKSGWGAALAGGLTLLVKEDAAVYVAVIGLWQLVKGLLRHRKRETLTGALLLAGSVGWFFLVTHHLAAVGDGVMTYRYQNFLYGGSKSLVTVIKSVLLCPMKAVYECASPEKLWFLAMTLGPLLGLPLFTRRWERYILLIPYILVNLMSDYPYQHDIFFQYTFGSTACLLYLTLVNLADWKRRQTAALTAAVAVCAICFGAVVVPKAMYYPVKFVRYQEYYAQIRQTLDEIPADAAVTATTFYTTYLSQRETLYDVGYASTAHLLSTEYVVFNPGEARSYKKYAQNGEDGYENLSSLLERNGYTLFAELENTLVIYHRPLK